MTTFHWFLPTSGDGHGVGAATVRAGAAAHERPATVGYLARVALAAERAGFTGALTPVGSGCPDPWLLCAAVAQYARRLRFLVAVRAGFTLPTLVAQQAQTFQAITGGRLALNVVTGGDPTEQRAYGDFLDHDERYARTAEYLDVLRRAGAGVPFDFDGDHYRVTAGGLDAALDPAPPVYFGGASPAAEAVAARAADVYLMWGEPPAAIAERIDRMRSRAAGHGRTLRFGLRVHAGIGLVREGAGTALVGGPDEVAARIAEYVAAGVDEFILSGWPHVEEAERVGALVLPRARVPQPIG